MGGQKADLAVTDPPYNVGYNWRNQGCMTIKNDKQEDSLFRQFLSDAFINMNTAMKPGASSIFGMPIRSYNFAPACKDQAGKSANA